MTADNPPESPRDLLEDIRSDVEQFLSGIPLDGTPRDLYEACRYVLSGGGKRVRPIATVLAGEAYGADREEVMPVAAAIEVFHNFTLVHDDVMDRSVTRRGRETVHVKWDESMAILAGDLLLGVAYELLADGPVNTAGAVRSAFSRMVRRLCEGQALDMAFERSDDVSVDEYLKMIDGKTGALLACCLECGALAAGAPSDVAANLHHAGVELGRAFQIQDDLLDATAHTERWGKRRGQDLIEGKRTYLIVDALEQGGATRSYVRDALGRGGFEPEEVDEAVEQLATSGVLDRAADRVSVYSESAAHRIERLPAGTPRDALLALIDQLNRRTH